MLVQDLEDQKAALGFTCGWDIRPDRKQAMFLRTSIRWFPSLALELDSNQEISFDNIEFNFIQLILFPNRL